MQVVGPANPHGVPGSSADVIIHICPPAALSTYLPTRLPAACEGARTVAGWQGQTPEQAGRPPPREALVSRLKSSGSGRAGSLPQGTAAFFSHPHPPDEAQPWRVSRLPPSAWKSRLKTLRAASGLVFDHTSGCTVSPHGGRASTTRDPALAPTLSSRLCPAWTPGPCLTLGGSPTQLLCSPEWPSACGRSGQEGKPSPSPWAETACGPDLLPRGCPRPPPPRPCPSFTRPGLSSLQAPGSSSSALLPENLRQTPCEQGTKEVSPAFTQRLTDHPLCPA